MLMTVIGTQETCLSSGTIIANILEKSTTNYPVENLEEMFSQYYIHSGVFIRFNQKEYIKVTYLNDVVSTVSVHT